MAEIFERAAALGVEPLVRTLLGCDWGSMVSTPDDTEPCPEQAVQITVLHDGSRQREVKLCQCHTDRICAETEPHKGTGPDDEHPADCLFCAAGEGSKHNYEPPGGT